MIGFNFYWGLACWIVRLHTYQGLLPFGAWLGLDCQATKISRFTTLWCLPCWIVRLHTYKGLLPFGAWLVGLSGYTHIKVYYPLALGLLGCQATYISRFTNLWSLACWIVRIQTYQGLIPFGTWLGLGCQATNISRFTTLWCFACWIVRLQTYQGLLPFGAWLGLDWVVRLKTYQGLLPFGA